MDKEVLLQNPDKTSTFLEKIVANQKEKTAVTPLQTPAERLENAKARLLKLCKQLRERNIEQMIEKHPVAEKAEQSVEE